MTPSRTPTRSSRSTACPTGSFRLLKAVRCFLLSVFAIHIAGCQFIGDSLYDSLFDTNTKTVTERRVNPHTNDQRAWAIEYLEVVSLTADQPGVSVVVNDQDLGPCPAVINLPPTFVQITEHGFYASDDVYRIRQRLDDEGNVKRIISETYLRTERRGPTRWIGHRTVTPDHPPLTVIWLRDGEPLGETAIETLNDPFTLKSPPPEADPVLIAALHELTWNRDVTDPIVPGQAHGRRSLHWPDRPTEPDASD